MKFVVFCLIRIILLNTFKNKYVSKLRLWEILVPVCMNDGHKIEIEHHKKWDKFVQELTNGLTIQKTSKGIWLKSVEDKYEEEMIPVKIACTKKQIKIISDYTAKHYEQKAIMSYPISRKVNIIEYDNNFNRIKKGTN